MSLELTEHGRGRYLYCIKIKLIFSYNFNRYTRLIRVAMRYVQVQACMAWYSTLGGAHSSLGDQFGVHVSTTS